MASLALTSHLPLSPSPRTPFHFLSPPFSPPHGTINLTGLSKSRALSSSMSERISKNRKQIQSVIVCAHLRFPVISPDDNWGTWTALFTTGAFGIWSERTKIGSMVGVALVSTLVGLAASNAGIIPYEAPAYSVVLEYLLPLIVPLLLFRADLRNVIRSTGTLFLAFLLGSDSCWKQ